MVDIMFLSVQVYFSKPYSLTFFFESTFIANNFLSDFRSTKNTSPNDPAPSSWCATKFAVVTLVYGLLNFTIFGCYVSFVEVWGLSVRLNQIAGLQDLDSETQSSDYHEKVVSARKFLLVGSRKQPSFFRASGVSHRFRFKIYAVLVFYFENLRAKWYYQVP